ncbi:MAG: PAS domain S-box protein [Legionellaceae bacterium]|nr:PAS domain S-box protein [Legionellaceae bacterium]
MNSWWSQERYSVSKRNAYFITIMLIVLFSIIRIWPLHMLGSYNPYLTYYPAIIISAVIGGLFAGLLATSMTCLIVSLFWWLLVNEPFIKVPSDWLAMTLFAFNGTLISSIAESMRRANERAQSELKQLEFSLSKMNALLEATPDCLIISNKEGQIIFANAVTEKIFGYTSEELVGQKIEFLIPTRYLKQHVNHRQHYFDKPSLRPMGIGLDLHGKHKDGHEFPVEISLSPIETEEGLLVIAAVRDITERKKSEDAKAMLSALVEGSDEAIIGKDLQGIVFSWNKSAEDLYGYTEAEMKGSSIKKLFPADKQDEFDSIIQQIEHGEHIKHKESFRVHKDGHIIPVSITISPIKNEKGDVIGASSTARDITQQKLFEEKLKHLAEHDPLTGLINRPFLEDHIEQAILLSK